MFAVTIPKWGLSMEEGTVVQWLKKEGDPVAEGEEIVEIETEKINNGMESPASGTLRRIVAPVGQRLAVGSLIAVLADSGASDEEVDAFIARQARAAERGDGGGADPGAFSHSTIPTSLGEVRVARGGCATGRPVVLLHGYAADLNGWLFTMEALARDFPVIAVDLPGHGESTKAVGDGSTATLAGVVIEVLDALKLDAVNLVGHSMGAAVATRVAAAHAPRVHTLVAVAPALYPGTRLSAEFLEGIATAQRARDLLPWLQQLVTDPALVTKEMIDNVVRYKRLDGVEEALDAIRRRLASADEVQQVHADLAQVRNLVVIVAGQDRVVGQADPAALPAGARLERIEDAGHVPHLERPAQLNALLRAALGAQA